jgi:hypothetical protein
VARYRAVFESTGTMASPSCSFVATRRCTVRRGFSPCIHGFARYSMTES